MRIIPVIDLLGGVVVRGIAGRRSEYRPIQSQLCASSEPDAIARALVENFGQPELYVADLDAIAGREPAWQAYEQIAAAGARLLIDAGVADRSRRRPAGPIPRGRPNAGQRDRGAGKCAIARGGRHNRGRSRTERTVFSLDMKHGRPLTSSPAWQGLSPLEIADQAVAAGVGRLIVLDLADVGTSGGVGTLELCRH